MDTKITLSFNAENINKAKKFAEDQILAYPGLLNFCIDR